jgi:two-component system, NarL family, nitrate/nitrite response regulator NarP
MTGSAPGGGGQIRVAIADHRRLIGESLAALIDTMRGFEVVGPFGGEKALSDVAAQRPDVLLVAMGGDRTEPLELVRALRRLDLNLAIVLLADVLVPELVRLVLDEHLNGLVLTDTPAADLAACLHQVAHGHAILPADWHYALARSRNDPLGSLSQRQLEVLKLVAEGYSYDEVGARLFISPNTVKFHLRTIYLRLGVRNRIAAARLLSEHTKLGTPLVAPQNQ